MWFGGMSQCCRMLQIASNKFNKDDWNKQICCRIESWRVKTAIKKITEQNGRMRQQGVDGYTNEERKHLAANCDPVKYIGHDNSTSQSHWCFLHFLLHAQFLSSNLLAAPAHFRSRSPMLSGRYIPSHTSVKNEPWIHVDIISSSIGSPNNFGEFHFTPMPSYRKWAPYFLCTHRYETVGGVGLFEKIQFSLSIVKRLVRLMWFFLSLFYQVLVLLLRRAACHIMLCLCECASSSFLKRYSLQMNTVESQTYFLRHFRPSYITKFVIKWIYCFEIKHGISIRVLFMVRVLVCVYTNMSNGVDASFSLLVWCFASSM